MSDHFSLPSAVIFAVGVATAAPNCTKPPFAVLDEVDVVVALNKIITCELHKVDELVLDVAPPKASRCPALVIVLATVDVAAPRLIFSYQFLSRTSSV